MQTQLTLPIAPLPLTDAHTHKHVCVGPNDFTVTLFGDRYGHDWSLGQLSDSRLSGEYRGRLGHVHQALSLGDAYVVDATEFNTQILHPKDFSVRDLSGHRYLRAPNLPAEGMSLRVGDAGVQSPAGCFTIIMTRPGYDPIKAHMGRWSLFDKYRIECGRPGRRHESVCHAALEELGVAHGSQADAKQVSAKILWGIRPEDFPHPLDGDSLHVERNIDLGREILDLGIKVGFDCVPMRARTMYPNLALVAKAQLMLAGVSEHHIDLTDAYLPRDGVYKDGRVGQPRNLVVVKRLK